MIIRKIAVTFVFLCCKQGFFPSKIKALCKQKCKLSRGIPGLLSAELYTFDGIFPHTIVTRSIKISTRAQFYTLDPFHYKKKSKDNRNVPDIQETQIALCALALLSRDTYKRRAAKSKKQRGYKICYQSVVKSGKEHMNERLKHFTATTEGPKEHADLGQPVM